MSRPSTIALLAIVDAFDALADRVDAELPVTCTDLATDLGISARSLVRIVERDTGLTWAKWVLPILRTSAQVDADDGHMKRITVSLDDATFTQLRQAALAEMRDPRLEARRILERALARRRGGVSADPSRDLAPVA